MEGSSLIVVMPVMILITLFTGISLPFIAARRSGRSHAGGRPPEPGADDTAPAGYLYVPCARIRYHGHPAGTRRWIQQVPIVKKTAKLIYYTSNSWDRREAVVSPGCISRDQFETDTRCHDDSEHGPHGEDRCRHGYPAGVIPVPGARHRPGPAGSSSPPAKPPKTTCTTGNAGEPDRPHREHHPSGNCAAPWPTPIPTVAARPSNSSKRAAGTRRRLDPPDGNVPWPARLARRRFARSGRSSAGRVASQSTSAAASSSGSTGTCHRTRGGRRRCSPGRGSRVDQHVPAGCSSRW